MRRQLELAGWIAVLVGAGVGVIVISSATAPAQSGGDWWDSGLFFPLPLALSVCCLAAGHRVPRGWPAFGLSAVAPYYAAQLGFGISSATGEGDGLWLAGLVFLVPLTVIPLTAAWIGARFGRRRSAPVR
jgi:hypothetical protein